MQLREIDPGPMVHSPTLRTISPTLEAHFGKFYGALDHGFIRVVDYMGNEEAIVRAARVSYQKGTKSVREDRGLLRYLMRHRHTTPLEMCEIVLHCKLPIFVARQWIRHRTANVNEMSARYSELPSEFYVPDLERIQVQSKKNKQGSGSGIDELAADAIASRMRDEGSNAFARYKHNLTVHDLARELARIDLPLSAYTEWYWKIDLHNLLHFLGLRLDPHAQYEIRVYADIIWKMVQDWLPNVAEAFVDYRLEAEHFSRHEMQLIRQFVRLAFARFEPEEMERALTDICPKLTGGAWEGLSGRERAAFIAKMMEE